jgi:hypothetical protein
MSAFVVLRHGILMFVSSFNAVAFYLSIAGTCMPVMQLTVVVLMLVADMLAKEGL